MAPSLKKQLFQTRGHVETRCLHTLVRRSLTFCPVVGADDGTDTHHINPYTLYYVPLRRGRTITHFLFLCVCMGEYKYILDLCFLCTFSPMGYC